MRRSRLFVIHAVAIVFGATPVCAAEWRYLTQADDKTIVTVDISSMRTLPARTGRDFEVVQVWVKYDYRFNTSEKARTAVVLNKVACDRDGMFSTQKTSYLPNGSVLESLSDIADYDFKYEPVAPETIGAAIVEFACGRRSIVG